MEKKPFNIGLALQCGSFHCKKSSLHPAAEQVCDSIEKNIWRAIMLFNQQSQNNETEFCLPSKRGFLRSSPNSEYSLSKPALYWHLCCAEWNRAIDSRPILNSRLVMHLLGLSEAGFLGWVLAECLRVRLRLRGHPAAGASAGSCVFAPKTQLGGHGHLWQKFVFRNKSKFPVWEYNRMVMLSWLLTVSKYRENSTQ